MFLDKKLKLEYENLNKNCFSSENKQEYFLEEYCPNNENERNLYCHGSEQWKLYNTKKFKIIIDTWDLNEAIKFLQSCQEKIKKEENKITSEWKIRNNK